MVSGPNATRTEIRHQDLIAAEHIERQKTVAIIETIEKTLLLLAVRWVIGSVVVENDPIAEQSDESTQPHVPGF